MAVEKMFHDKQVGKVHKSDIAWAAGLFEGEGSIVTNDGHIRLQLKMTDEDVVRRFAMVLGGNVTGPYSYEQADGHKRKPAWCWSINGAKAKGAARAMEPWLGKRRRARMAALGMFTQMQFGDDA